jgi:signal-transduction protein with cAMP-binding, CBS, and nucleotidyltransferase domain
VVAESRGPFKTTLKEILSSSLVTVDEATPVKDAVALMRRNAIRRMQVLKEEKVVGILTLKSIIGNNRNESVDLVEVELPATVDNKVMCPYCQSRFADKE